MWAAKRPYATRRVAQLGATPGDGLQLRDARFAHRWLLAACRPLFVRRQKSKTDCVRGKFSIFHFQFSI
jgi:hypothetical protein